MSGTGAMLALMMLGIARFRRDGIQPWALVAAGLSAAWVGMFLMNYGSRIGLSFGQPSVLDALMLINYPLATAGALIMLARQHLRTGLHTLLETVTLTLAGGLLIFAFVGVRVVQQVEISLAARIVALLYPVGNVLLLAVLAAIAVRLRNRPGGLLLIGLGFAGNLVADLLASHQRLEGVYRPGGWIDFGWLLCFIGISIAPSWPDGSERTTAGSSDPSMTPSGVIDADDGRIGFGHRLILLAALLSVPVLLLVHRGHAADASELVMTVGTMAILGLVLARVGLYYNDLRRSELALREAHAALEEADADRQALLWRLHRAVEEERTRIAADIHDRPVQQLAAVSYKLETVAMALVSGDVDRAEEVTDQAAEELSVQLAALRNLMAEIRPPVLDQRGLLGAISDTARTWAADYPDIELDVAGADVHLAPENETVLYRISQEALSNIAKHAAASTVQVRLTQDHGLTTLTVRDDGRGFDASMRSDMVRSGHFGLAGMGERAAMVGGEFDVASAPGAGTILRITVPNTDATSTPSPEVGDKISDPVGA